MVTHSKTHTATRNNNIAIITLSFFSALHIKSSLQSRRSDEIYATSVASETTNGVLQMQLNLPGGMKMTNFTSYCSSGTI
jgi:hypothetical protein